MAARDREIDWRSCEGMSCLFTEHSTWSLYVSNADPASCAEMLRRREEAFNCRFLEITEAPCKRTSRSQLRGCVTGSGEGSSHTTPRQKEGILPPPP